MWARVGGTAGARSAWLCRLVRAHTQYVAVYLWHDAVQAVPCACVCSAVPRRTRSSQLRALTLVLCMCRRSVQLLGAMTDDETESDDDGPMLPTTTTARTTGASGASKPSGTATRITLSALAADSDSDSDGDLGGALLPAAPLPGRRQPRTSSAGASADASLGSGEPASGARDSGPASVSSAATSGVEDPSLAPSASAIGASAVAVDQSAAASETGSEASAAGREASATRATLFAYFADTTAGGETALSVDGCLKVWGGVVGGRCGPDARVRVVSGQCL